MSNDAIFPSIIGVDAPEHTSNNKSEEQKN
jgi:hypothetical protein